ncbi:hypothetical protein [Neisseria maigaei]|uniref:hypothetical protein n=1 Tax=Neisseria maigaei TaxID=2830651 RepID=UPI00265A123E|nr:hypothetical protein [Neisseria maigaei]
MPSEAFSGFRRHLFGGAGLFQHGYSARRAARTGERRFPFPACCRYGWRRFA